MSYKDDEKKPEFKLTHPMMEEYLRAHPEIRRPTAEEVKKQKEKEEQAKRIAEVKKKQPLNDTGKMADYSTSIKTSHDPWEVIGSIIVLLWICWSMSRC